MHVRLMLCVLALASSVLAQDKSAVTNDEDVFKDTVQPLLKQRCYKCHNADEMKSGVRVDHLTATPEDKQLFLLKAIQRQIDEETMPPSDAPQLTAAERTAIIGWITRTIAAARARDTQKNGLVRRLTVSQYRNTLRDLLGLQEDLTDSLPPDGISKDGFANNAQTLLLSPLQVETYFEIAEQALNLCLVDETSKPVIQNFRMDLGAGINPQPLPEKLVLGALSMLLENSDFTVTELKPQKPFEYQPFSMKTHLEYIEGYAGNDTVRGWKKFDSIYHAVFACVRGTPGYPKGEAYQPVPEGLLLRPAIPSPEIFGQSNTYGPMANFKISLRELPEHGNFRVTVKAARYVDGMLLDPGSKPFEPVDTVTTSTVEVAPESGVGTVTLKQEGIYQIDLVTPPAKGTVFLDVTSPAGALVPAGDRRFAGQLQGSNRSPADGDPAFRTHAFLVVRLAAGETILKVRTDKDRPKQILLSRLPEGHPLALRFLKFEQRSPSLGVYVGLRRDCGSTLAMVGEPKPVSGGVEDYVFEGAIRDFPNPDVEKDNVNYLAGIREIGVRSEYTDGRDVPRLLVKSVEFEGPFYETWPPATHRNILIDSPNKNDPPTYAADVLRNFATKAFRRPVTAAELESLVGVWKSSFAESADARQALRDALLVVLTSPQFLFLIENSSSPAAEDLDEYELASKLSYFLWNTAPDSRLLDLAAKGQLRASVDAELERMIHDPRFGQFVTEFATQWLSLDKFDVVAVDAMKYPTLTRDTKAQLRLEPVQTLKFLLEQNLPLRHLVQSDTIVANEVVASYYGLGDRTESGFRFQPLVHESKNLGGVLSQAAILSGLSDGRESNPVKRGAWLARKIIARPPDDPPPNVPQLPENDGSKLTLREKLEQHRNQKGCIKCHSGIDPWGVPFETFDAGGLFKLTPVDARSKLPDGTEVADLDGLKGYLAGQELDRVAFSVLKHLATYAIGRSLTYNEQTWLEEEAPKLKANDYRTHDLLRMVIHSDAFFKK